MFVRMLALIFASYRLFPKDHPALTDTRIRLTLGTVIATAYSQLSFTKKGIPQIILFVAVVGCLFFSVMIVLTILSSLFVSSAHAQGLFTSPAGEDWGIQWINYLFMGDKMTLTGTSVDAPTYTKLQQAMGTALSFYSTAILALAGLLLIYHLTFMIAETAHTGKPMGRANQIWGPIRLVFAIGMLVPIGASTGSGTATVTGYNTAQYLAMQVGRWGSGLASQAWSTFSSSINTEASLGVCESGKGSPSCLNLESDARNTVVSLIAMDACAYITNFYIAQSGINGNTSSFDWLAGVVTSSSTTNKVLTLPELAAKDPIKEGKHFLSLEMTSNNDFDAVDPQEFCGGYQVRAEPDGPYKGVFTAQLNKFEGLLTDVHTYVSTYGPDMITSSGAYSNKTVTQRAAALDSLISTFETNLTTAVQGAFAGAKTKADQQLKDAVTDKHFSDTGWLTAASWFNRITSLMAQRMSALRSALPTFIKPSIIMDIKSDYKASEEILSVIQDSHRNYKSFMGSVSTELKYTSKNATSNCDDGKGISDVSLTDLVKSANPVVTLLNIVDCIAIHANIWDVNGNLSLKFGAALNPLAEVAAWGQNNVSLGTTLMGVGAGVYASSIVLGQFAAFIGSILISIASLFYMVGFTFGFIVPLYPFYRFFFGALQWIMSVFELVVLAPLFALAHVNPYGEGLAGQYGKYGYSVAMQVLLRPILMVFGLIAGYLLFAATLHFLNDVFMITARGTGAYTDSNEIIARIVYTVIYCVLVLILANQCFSTIGLFPQVALSYLGMGKVQEEQIKDTGLLTAGAAYVGKDMLGSKLPGLVKGPTDMISNMRKNSQDLKDKKQGAKDGVIQHLESLGPDKYKDSKFYNPNDKEHQNLFDKNQSQFSGGPSGNTGGSSSPSGSGGAGGPSPSGGGAGGGAAGNMAGGTGSAGRSDDDGFTPGAV
ncbi:MAG: DotA/TraY family protein [Alphaproteobacteria bacterium]|nr:DotA/TraY family protein [Alphaproteobacteria bacterium]